MSTKPNGNGFSPTNGDGGRPSKYRKEYNKIARQMCKIGATDTEIAEALDIDRTTLWDWKRLHTAFTAPLAAWKTQSARHRERLDPPEAIEIQPDGSLRTVRGEPKHAKPKIHTLSSVLGDSN